MRSGISRLTSQVTDRPCLFEAGQWAEGQIVSHGIELFSSQYCKHTSRERMTRSTIVSVRSNLNVR